MPRSTYYIDQSHLGDRISENMLTTDLYTLTLLCMKVPPPLQLLLICSQYFDAHSVKPKLKYDILHVFTFCFCILYTIISIIFNIILLKQYHVILRTELKIQNEIIGILKNILNPLLLSLKKNWKSE